MSYTGLEHFRTQRRDEYARKRGFDSWDAYLESKCRENQLRNAHHERPVTPPWVVLGWSRRKYRQWLKSLEKTLPIKSI